MREGCPRGVEPAASTFTGSRAEPLPHRHQRSAEGAGVEPARPYRSIGFQPIPVARRVALPFRGEGLEPSLPGSKPGRLPLADPREYSAGVGPALGFDSPFRLLATKTRPAHRGFTASRPRLPTPTRLSGFRDFSLHPPASRG